MKTKTVNNSVSKVQNQIIMEKVRSYHGIRLLFTYHFVMLAWYISGFVVVVKDKCVYLFSLHFSTLYQLFPLSIMREKNLFVESPSHYFELYEI
jgi:hypothetical protein